MAQTTTSTDERQLLAQVHEGMRVYDRDGGDVGLVDRVYLGAASDTAYERGEGPATAPDPNAQPNNLLQDFAHVFEPDTLPEELRQRLLNRGFVRVSGSGILAADKYLLPDQIDRVFNNRLMLKVPRKDLIKS